MILWVLLGIVVVALVAGFLFLRYAETMGAAPTGERLARMQASPYWKDGVFQNPVPTEMDMPIGTMVSATWSMLKGAPGREPVDSLPMERFDAVAWGAVPDTAMATAWFGHSSLLIKIGGRTFLTDPVFSARASSFTWAGPERFKGTEAMSVADLPAVDVVLLSHDHYDHLDHLTIKELVRERPQLRYVAPLGVGAHLERWGVPADAITEVDRWGTAEVGDVQLTLTPTRHFSGRGFARNGTLWGGWALKSATRHLLFGADSGYSPAYAEVGERLGPFDLVLLECGAYNTDWAQIHMMPEETAQAAKDLRARVLQPIHWGKFSLALHPWKEPMERLLPAAEKLELPLLTPRLGAIVQDADSSANTRWWEGLR